MTSAPPSPPETQGFDRVWAVLREENRPLSEAELRLLLEPDGDALWSEFLRDERFLTSVVSRPNTDGDMTYQSFTRTAEEIAKSLGGTSEANSRAEICGRLGFTVGDEVWSNIVKRLRYSAKLQVVEDRGEKKYSLPSLSPVQSPETAASAPAIDTHSGALGHDPTAPSSALDVGAVIAERYVVGGLLGRGGFGVVYKGTQENTGTPVAIKLLTVGAQHSAEVRAQMAARFEREMQLLARLNHPNIVKLYDSGQLEDGALYTVLEFIEGVPLDRHLKKNGAMPPREIFRLMRQVVNVLHHAHRQGVIHRDLKPANIMVTDPGPYCNAMVLDFGIASLQANDPASPQLTAANHFLGTPHYMAPEQIKGTTTPQIDLYAWGMVLRECFTGETLYKDKPMGWVLAQQVSDEPIDTPDALIETPLGKILTRALAKDPEQRYQHAEEILIALDEVDPRGLDSHKVQPPADAIKSDGAPEKNNGDSPWVAVGLVAALIIFVVILLVRALP